MYILIQTFYYVKYILLREFLSLDEEVITFSNNERNMEKTNIGNIDSDGDLCELSENEKDDSNIEQENLSSKRLRLISQANVFITQAKSETNLHYKTELLFKSYELLSEACDF